MFPSPELLGVRGKRSILGTWGRFSPASIPPHPSWNSSCRPGPLSSWRRRRRTPSCGWPTRRCGRNWKWRKSSSADWRATCWAVGSKPNGAGGGGVGRWGAGLGRALRGGPSGADPEKGRAWSSGLPSHPVPAPPPGSPWGRVLQGVVGHLEEPPCTQITTSVLQRRGRGLEEHAEREAQPPAATGTAQVRQEGVSAAPSSQTVPLTAPSHCEEVLPCVCPPSLMLQPQTDTSLLV